MRGLWTIGALEDRRPHLFLSNIGGPSVFPFRVVRYKFDLTTHGSDPASNCASFGIAGWYQEESTPAYSSTCSPATAPKKGVL